MCGVVDGGIVAGPVGLRGRAERRRRHLRLVRRHLRAARVPRGGRGAATRVHELLTELAAAQAVGEHGLVALDWHSGNRSVLVDHELSGVVRRADPGDPARGHLPGAARGHRVRHPHDHRGVRARRRAGRASSIVAGGLLKNALLMQIYADVPGCRCRVIGSEQGPALGSAIHAAVAAGAYPDIRAAARGHGQACTAASTCRTRTRAAAYDELYAEYLTAARLLRPRRQRRDAPAARRRRRAAAPRSGRDDAAGRRSTTPSARCARGRATCTPS